MLILPPLSIITYQLHCTTFGGNLQLLMPIFFSDKSHFVNLLRGKLSIFLQSYALWPN